MKRMPSGPYPVEVTLCLDRRDWRRTTLRRCHERIEYPKSEGIVMSFHDANGSPWLVVNFIPALLNRPIWERVGIVAHEATHVWQFIVEHCHITKHDDEIEALHVQWVTRWLLEEMASAGWLER